MKIPTRQLGGWSKELIDECSVSRQSRMSAYRSWTDIFYTGSDTDTPSKRNRCYSHCDKLSSYLFSPSEVQFDIDYDGVNEPDQKDIATKAQSVLNRQFSRRRCDVTFSQGTQWSLVKGATIGKLVWGRGGFEPWAIQPEFFGVLREDIEDLDRQDAFVHSFFLTETQFKRMVGSHPDRVEIMKLVQAGFSEDSEGMIDSSSRDLTIGGGYPNAVIGIPGVTGSVPQQYGNVDWTTRQASAQLAPEVRSSLIRVDDLWVWDDKREDWTTIRYADPGVIIEGKYQHRNLSDAGKGEHPFVKICSNDVPGYFWGRSEIANVWPNQRLLSARLSNIDSIFNQQARPARSILGSASISDEKLRVLLTAGGTLSDPSPTGKIETYKPDMPQGYMEFLNYLDSCFDESAGFTKMLQGEGEAGVRAGVHANTLLRTSSPRLRDRALLVEKQAAEWGDLCLNMLRTKDATVMRTAGGQEFMFSQLPDDASVVVDSHTSSPAFSGDNQQLLFALNKAGAVGPKQLIEGTHPPRQEALLAELAEQDKAREAQLQELKQSNPEAWAKAISGTSGRRR